MMKRVQGFALVAVALALSACGDRVQTIGVNSTASQPLIGVSTSKPLGGNAWDVSSSDPYVAPGWKAGDPASWNDHLRRRTQLQNDYAPR